MTSTPIYQEGNQMCLYKIVDNVTKITGSFICN